MKGKKLDAEFVSNYISKCINNGYDSDELILQQAQANIAAIDEEIKRIEGLKVERSKLLDVVESFNKKPVSNAKEKKVLTFLTLKHPEINKFICHAIELNSINIRDITYNSKYSSSDIIFCIKQLINHGIIYKPQDHLLRGENYDLYMEQIVK